VTRDVGLNNMSTPIERWYHRWEGTLQILILIVIPLVVYLYGDFITRSTERSKVAQEYIKQSIAILSEKIEIQPTRGVGNIRQLEPAQEAMRTWAVDILSTYSPTPLNQEQRKALISGEATTVFRYDSYTPGER